MGFTKSKYMMKEPHSASNYDPDNNVIRQEENQMRQKQIGIKGVTN